VLELEERVRELEAQRDALQAELEAHREALQAAVAERDARLARLTAGRGEGDRVPAPEVPDP
jgi:outer membrane murein-binding lipoprotein Lpp